MGIVKSGGVIISAKDSGETSRLVEVFTEQYGLLKVMAKGARRSKSRFGAATEPLTYIHGVYYLKEDSGIASLSAADIVFPFEKIRGDLEKFSYGSAWAEFLLGNLPPGEAQKPLFRQFLMALKTLENVNGDQNEKFFWAYLLKFISLLGFRPEFSICAGCSVVHSKDWMFSVENGRLYCDKCSRSLRDSLFIRLDTGENRVLSAFINSDSDVLSRLTVTRRQMKIVKEVIEGLRKYHTAGDGELKSLNFIHRVSKDNID